MNKYNLLYPKDNWIDNMFTRKIRCMFKKISVLFVSKEKLEDFSIAKSSQSLRDQI